MTDRWVAGVDGARGAWVVAYLPVAVGPGARLEFEPSFAAVRAAVDRAGCVAVGVDMPIGLAARGLRRADAEARARLGPRRSTLFPTPVVGVLDATTHAEAVVINRDATGVGISVQAWNLVPRIREVRACLTAADADRFAECHPESSFVELVGQALPSKKTAAGVGRRLAALRTEVPDLDDVLARAPAACAIDDALDALAAAWSARRLARGSAITLGDGALDEAGLPLRIVI